MGDCVVRVSLEGRQMPDFFPIEPSNLEYSSDSSAFELSTSIPSESKFEQY